MMKFWERFAPGRTMERDEVASPNGGPSLEISHRDRGEIPAPQATIAVSIETPISSDAPTVKSSLVEDAKSKTEEKIETAPISREVRLNKSLLSSSTPELQKKLLLKYQESTILDNVLVVAEAENDEQKRAHYGGYSVAELGEDGKPKKENNDRYGVFPNALFVADGAGDTGFDASKLVADKVQDFIQRWDPNVETDPVLIRSEFKKFYEKLITEFKNLDIQGDSTLSLGIIIPFRGKKFIVGFNVGDSRLHGLTANGTLEQLSVDDGIENDWIPKNENGDFEPERVKMRKIPELSEAENAALKSLSLSQRAAMISMIDECRTTTDFVSFMAKEMVENGIPDLLVTPRILKILRKQIFNAVGKDSNGSYTTFIKDLSDVKVILGTSDGIHDVNRRSELGKIVKSASEKFPENATALATDVGAQTATKNQQLLSGSQLSKNDDQSVVAIQITDEFAIPEAYLSKPEQAVGTLIFAHAENIHSTYEFVEKLRLFYRVSKHSEEGINRMIHAFVEAISNEKGIRTTDGAPESREEIRAKLDTVFSQSGLTRSYKIRETAFRLVEEKLFGI